MNDLALSRSGLPKLPIAAAGVVGFFSLVVMIAAPSPAAALLCINGMLALLIVLFPVLCEKPFNPFHPLILLGLTVFFGTTLRSFHLVFTHSDATVFLLRGEPVESVLPGSFIVLAGMLAITCGYYVLGARRLQLDRAWSRVMQGPWNLRRLDILAAAIFLLILVVAPDYYRRTGWSSQDISSIGDAMRTRVVQIDGGQAGETTPLAYHMWAMQMVDPMFYMYLMLFLSNTKPRSRYFVRAAIFGALACMFPLSQGARTLVLKVLVSALVLVSLRIHLRMKWLIGAGFSGLVLVFLIGALRGGLSLGELMTQLTPSYIGDVMLGTHNYVDVTKISQIYTAVPDRIPYKLGATYSTLITAPIPRSLWSGKPSLNFGLELTEELYGGRRFGTGIEFGSTPAGLLGESILNFGAFFVPIVCFLYGALLRLFYNSFNSGRPVTMAGAIVYASILYSLTFAAADSEFTRTVITVVTGALPCILCIYFVSNERGGLGSRAAMVPSPTWPVDGATEWQP